MKTAGQPRLLFFTGGTALKSLSRTLARRNLRTVHLVTTFDSGGSSAALRKAFAMPAVGDLRNRLLALADAAIVPAPVLEFCKKRLPRQESEESLRSALYGMGRADAQAWKDMPAEYFTFLRGCLNLFLERMTPAFDPRGACLGNLVLTGAYLGRKRDFAPVLALFSRMLAIKGIVLPIVNESLHLGAILESGEIIIGQHLFKKLPAPVREIFLTVQERTVRNLVRCRPPALAEAANYISTADAVCYPMGSFYSSVLANLLPQGVGRAVAAGSGAKIFIPNSGEDSELKGQTIPHQMGQILRTLREDAPDAQNRDFLQFVLVDAEHGQYPGGLGPEIRRQISAYGAKIVERNIVSPENPQQHAPDALLEALLEIATRGRING